MRVLSGTINIGPAFPDNTGCTDLNIESPAPSTRAVWGDFVPTANKAVFIATFPAVCPIDWVPVSIAG